MNIEIPESLVRPCAWIATNGGPACEPWLLYEKADVDALPAGCVADPVFSAHAMCEIDALASYWRDLARRLYVELHHCDQQMTSGRRPKWKTGAKVREALNEAKQSLNDDNFRIRGQ